MIKFLFMDVDGTLTDGNIYIGENGELFKAFNVKDGCGIKDLMPQYGLVPVIVTGRSSSIVSYRCRELNIQYLFQGVSNKTKTIRDFLDDYNLKNRTAFSLKNCAYIGDDSPDLPSMKEIKKAGGLIGCPVDAINDVHDISDFISNKKGGSGAVREFIEWIINQINS